ncbi:hypothetical protein E2C01_002503 [Portunus trituberculatus]|uniref:Uncharacterized protein n=1 Tax=Portunus trituberculatus TaxID=210409 RepID=A0A5B7CNF6_PORTR|nr:hypothetical protein [Portunus trituberculatus]
MQPTVDQLCGDAHLEVVGDEDTTHIQLDVVGACAVLVEGLAGLHFWDKQQGLEGHLTLGNEVSLGQRILGVLAQRLVEFVVLFVLNLRWLPGPDGLGIIHQSPVPCCLGNLLCLGFVLFFLLYLSFLVFLNLVLLLFFFHLILIQRLLHLFSLGLPQCSGHTNILTSLFPQSHVPEPASDPPLFRVSPRGSSTTENSAESDSQMCCWSALFLDVTTTRSATKKAE